jgi:hypothetical protein
MSITKILNIIMTFGNWSLGIGAYLELGIWLLKFIRTNLING